MHLNELKEETYVNLDFLRKEGFTCCSEIYLRNILSLIEDYENLLGEKDL